MQIRLGTKEIVRESHDREAITTMLSKERKCYTTSGRSCVISLIEEARVKLSFSER